MMAGISRTRLVRACVLVASAAAFLAVPASGAPEGRNLTNLSHFSQTVALHYWLANPNAAPERFGPLTARVAAKAAALRAQPNTADLFNRDTVGLPQNEESVAAGCNSYVLEGTNDYRGILDPQGNFTGWHFSKNGGRSLATEGLLPPVTLAGAQVPSGGDPVDRAGSGCHFYAGSLNYDPVDPFGKPNGVGVYRTTAATLLGCPGGSNPACWPTRRAVATANPPHFLDKEWMDVGVSGSAGEVVWVSFSDFVNDFTAPVGFTSASIKAVRCTADLATCTAPILISGADKDIQFSDVTVGPDGRTYITWAEIQGELEQTAQTFIVKLRVAEPGSTSFGPTRIVARVPLALSFGGVLHANDFRNATVPKSEVGMVGGHPRVFVTWDECRARILGDTVCEEPRIKLAWSDDFGASWHSETVSVGGDNYFPTVDVTGNRVAVAWFTNRRDRVFHNRQEVELVTVNAATSKVTRRQIVTPVPNETEADPGLGGFFIGDYIEVFARGSTAWVGYNANYRKVRVLGEGLPVPQQDNYLARRGL